MGVPVGEIRDHMADQNDGQIFLRPQWVQDGRRRAREAQAHAGCDDIVGVMRYWAKKDLGVDLLIEYFDAPGGL